MKAQIAVNDRFFLKATDLLHLRQHIHPLVQQLSLLQRSMKHIAIGPSDISLPSSTLYNRLQKQILDYEDVSEKLRQGALLLDGAERYLESIIRDRFRGQPQRFQRYLTPEPHQTESFLDTIVRTGITVAFLIQLLTFLYDTLTTIAGQFAIKTYLEYQVGHHLLTFHQLGAEPWRFLIPGGPLMTYWSNRAQFQAKTVQYLKEEAFPELLNLLESRLGIREAHVQQLTHTLVYMLASYGVIDRAQLFSHSKLPVQETRRRILSFMAEAARHGRKTRHRLSTPLQYMHHKLPTDISTYLPSATLGSQNISDTSVRVENLVDVMLEMVEIDMIGGTDEAVIRTLIDIEGDGKMILIFPSTQEWFLPSQTPNDALGNIELLRGGSAMVDMAYQAVQSLQESEIPIHDILILGFSQGGMASFAFAQQYGQTLPIRHLVTFGSPVGKFRPLPEHISSLSFEFPQDPVPKLDGTKNPETSKQTTVIGEHGSHNLFDYMKTVEDIETISQHPEAVRQLEHIKEYLGHDYDIHDFYARRETGSENEKSIGQHAPKVMQ